MDELKYMKERIASLERVFERLNQAGSADTTDARAQAECAADGSFLIMRSEANLKIDAFVRRYGIAPNAIFLGDWHRRTLATVASWLKHQGYSSANANEFLGLRVLDTQSGMIVALIDEEDR